MQHLVCVTLVCVTTGGISSITLACDQGDYPVTQTLQDVPQKKTGTSNCQGHVALGLYVCSYCISDNTGQTKAVTWQLGSRQNVRVQEHHCHVFSSNSVFSRYYRTTSIGRNPSDRCCLFCGAQWVAACSAAGILRSNRRLEYPTLINYLRVFI